MRLEELKNKTDEEQNEMIWSCPMYKTKEILDNPELIKEKFCCSGEIMMV